MRSTAPRLLTGLVLALALRTAPPLGADAEAPDVPPEVQRVIDGLAAQDREQRQAAAESAVPLPHPALLAPLQKAAKDEYRSVREAVFRALATRAAAEERRKASRTLEARLKELDKRPETKDELLVVVQALHDLAQDSAIEPLLDGLEPVSEPDVAQARLRAVGNLPSREAVERLIAYAARGRRGESHRGATLKALEYATNVKLGNLDAWHRWWAENKRTFDPDAAARARAEARAAAAARQKERDERRARRDEARSREKPAEGGEAKPEPRPDAPPAPGPAPEPTPDQPPEDARPASGPR